MHTLPRNVLFALLLNFGEFIEFKQMLLLVLLFGFPLLNYNNFSHFIKIRTVITQCLRNKQNLLKNFSPGFEIKKKIIRYYFKNIAGK